MELGEATRLAALRGGVACVACLWALGWCGAASGQESTIDYFVGPIISSGRVVGMGGAFIGVGEGADGHLINPASFAVRYAYSGDDWFDWDYALSWLNVGVKDGIELDRSGQEGVYNEAFIFQLGFNLKFGRHGVGFHAANQAFTARVPSASGEEVELRLEQGFGGLGYAYAFWDGELTVGGVTTTGSASLSAAGRDPLEVSGEGLLLGALWAPCRAPWRLGAALQTAVTGRQQTGDRSAWGELVPDAVAVPWQLGVGGSWMWGSRQYNICPSYGEWEEVSEVPPVRASRREYVLLATDLVMFGPSPEGYGAQGLLAGELQPSGRRPSVSMRLGVESEVWSNRLVLRGGSYWEPSRFEAQPGRVHGTFGADLRLGEFLWLMWKVSVAGDVASRYSNIGVGLGIWR